MRTTAELADCTRLAAAVSSAVRPLVRGPARPGRVVSSTRHAVLIALERPVGLVCVGGPGAVRLPCSLVLTEPPPRAVPGTAGTVGGGRVTLSDVAGADVTVEVGRWWQVPRPTLTEPRLAAARAAALGPDETAATGLPPAEIAQLRAALSPPGPDPARLRGAVARLLGLGPGLTPAGDDLLAGALVASNAADHPSAAQLALAVTAADPLRRTTLVSAVLLEHAARGECVPELAGLLFALQAGADVNGADVNSADVNSADVNSAVDALLKVGHTSGPALLHGARIGLATAAGPAPGTTTRREMTS